MMEFEQLLMKCDIQEMEEQTIVCFLGKLNVEIVDIVQLQPYWIFNDVIQLALKVEKQRVRKTTNGLHKQKETPPSRNN